MSVKIETWLDGIGLGRYTATFRSNEIDASVLRRLNSADLKEMGITALGHRKKLLEAIAALGEVPAVGASIRGLAATHIVDSIAERRQLTVMFCDLVGSTALAGRLDPEDLQHLIGDYHRVVAQAVAPFDGHVAQFLGDGVLVYFGYPQAHEDDAGRAVRSALGIAKALVARRDRGAQGGPELEARIGIATGLVVISEIGTGTTAAELSASGETPNLAARLQGQAQPGEILLSDETRRLVGESFVLEPLGALDLKGFAAPVEAWRVVTERSVATRFEAQHKQGMVEFIGRESEVALLLDRWALARDGEGQGVLLTGEAGIGKSRICLALRDQLAGESVATMLLQCSPYFSSSALYPVLQHLERMAGLAATDSPEVRADKVEQRTGVLSASSLGCLLRLMGLPDGGRSAPPGASPQEEKTHTLEALIDLVQHLCEQQPVLLLVEDAHWIDPTTEELIAQIAQLARNTRLLLLVTGRPEYLPSWGHAEQLTRLSLNRLSHRQCAALASAVAAGKALPDELLAEIIHKTDGIPLFVEELTKTVLQSGLLEDTPSGYRLRGPLSALAIPATLQDSLMARLDRLAPAKEVAQVGAVIGREFTHRLIADVLKPMPETRLEEALIELVRSELVFRRGTPPDASYSFKHALVRDTAYNSMLRSQRVMRHRQIAAALEQGNATSSQPELLAVHHQEGGNSPAALRYWQAAGEAAMARSAMREAVSHYRAAIAMLDKVTSAEGGAVVELDLRMRLGNALLQTEGFTSAYAYESYAKARDLAIALDRPDENVQACGGMAAGLNAAGKYGEAIAMMEGFGAAELARMKPMGRVNRLVRMGHARTFRGELAEAGIALAEARIELENLGPEDRQPMGGVDAMVAVLMHLNQNLVFRGFFQSADDCVREGLGIAEQRQHSNSRVWALCRAGAMSELKGDSTDAITRFTQALELAERYSLKMFGALAKCGYGRALVVTGQTDDGTRLLREGYSEWMTFGGRQASTQRAAAAAEVLIGAGRRDEATEFLLAGEKTLNETEEKFQGAAFLFLRGRLRELDEDVAGAEKLYRQAIATAEQQGALLFTLQGTAAMARVCQRRGRRDEADTLLRPIYARFTEGFDFPILVNARAVLEGRG